MCGCRWWYKKQSGSESDDSAVQLANAASHVLDTTPAPIHCRPSCNFPALFCTFATFVQHFSSCNCLHVISSHTCLMHFTCAVSSCTFMHFSCFLPACFWIQERTMQTHMLHASVAACLVRVVVQTNCSKHWTLEWISQLQYLGCEEYTHSSRCTWAGVVLLCLVALVWLLTNGDASAQYASKTAQVTVQW